MAINSNHISEELDGIKCAIVEKNASSERVAFLKPLLEINGLKVVVVPSPPAKPAAATPTAETDAAPAVEVPETFTIGVTNLFFNPINAVYGRLLKSADGHTVTLAYWQQKETVSNDEIPYFSKHS